MLAVLAALMLGAFLLLARDRDRLAERPPRDRPDLLLLTSLPILFGEEFAIDGHGSPLLTALERRYRVRPIDVASRQALAGHRLLLMAHPLAQPAEALVALDEWVRSGGRVLLLADPELSWPSERPLGDLLRPPPAFADTGLLARWGLTLTPPDSPAPVERKFAGRRIIAQTPGRWAGRCAIGPRQFVARCRVGQGHALLIADADFLRPPGGGDPDAAAESVLLALKSLER